MTGEAVGKRAIRGTAWIGASRFGAHGLRVIRDILLAWLLGTNGPDYFGIFAVALLALRTVEALSQTGISQAVIQKEGEVGPYLDTAWTSQLLRGAVLAAALYFGAPYLAEFLDKEGVTEPLRVLAIAPLLTGAQSVGVLFFSRDLQFHKTFVLLFGAGAVDLLVTAVAALINPSVWALVLGNLAGIAYMVVASYAMATRRARLGFSWPRMRELSGFGFWIFATSLVAFALIQGGDFVIAKLLPAATLGVYSMAARFSMLPALELARVISTVTFPAYSLLQSKPERLQQAFLKAFYVVGVVGFAATGCVIVAAEDFVAFVLSDEWVDVAPLMAPLAIWGLCRGLGASQSSLFQAAGRPALATVFPALMLVAFVASVVPVVNEHGAVGLAWLLAGIGTIAQLLRYPLAAWVLDLKVRSVLMRTVVPLSALLVGLGVHRVLDEALRGVHSAPRLVVLLASFCVVYGATLMLWDRLSGYKLLPLVREVLRARKKPTP